MVSEESENRSMARIVRMVERKPIKVYKLIWVELLMVAFVILGMVFIIVWNIV